MKSEIIARLGQTDILLPSLIAEGLAANDRVKARLSVLQAAGRHARDPSSAKFDLTDECRTVGLDAVAMESLVNRARLLAGELVTAPGLDSLGSAIWDDVATMILAVEAGDKVPGEAARERLSVIRSANEPELLRHAGACADCRTYRNFRWRRSRLASLGDGPAQELERTCRRARRGGAGERSRLWAIAARPACDRGFHARGRIDPPIKIRPSGAGDNRNSIGRAAHPSERYRRNRRPCGGDRCRNPPP